MAAMSTPVAAQRAQERWFLDRGLPSVVTQRARTRAIWPRSAPCLAFFATLTACSTATYQLTGRHEYSAAPTEAQRIGLSVALLALPVAAGIGWFVARKAHRSCAGHCLDGFGGDRHRQRGGEGADVRTAFGVSHRGGRLACAGARADRFGAGLGDRLGGPAGAYAARRRMGPADPRPAGGFAFGAGVFQYRRVGYGSKSQQAPVRFGTDYFLVIAAAFVVQETMENAKPTLMAATASSRHAKRLADTPFEHLPAPAEVRPLTRGERFNVVFVLAATQLARVFTVAFVTWALFFIMGLVLITPDLVRTWTQHAISYDILLGYPILVPQALFRMTMFLGALTFMYVSARAAGDGDYQHRFLDPLIDDLKLTLLARNRYLAHLDAE
jgi:hypothetical protein